MGKSESGDRRPLVAVSAIATGAVVAYLIASAPQPLRLNWGDPWSDLNVLTSGRFFARDGFARLAFTPVIDVGPLTDESLRYTHYPPLPDILNGFEQTIFGAADISVFRIVALAFTFGALALFFRYVSLVWGKTAALFALPLFSFNLLFLQYADTIHHIPLYWFTGFGALYAAARWLGGGGPKNLGGLAAAVFFCGLASYDYYFFLPLMLGATVLTMGLRLFEPRARQLLLTGAAALIGAVLAKTLLVVWAVGWHGFLADFIFQFQERATSQHAPEYKDAIAPLLMYRLWRFFGPPFFVLLGAHLIAVADRLRGVKTDVRASPLLVLGAGLPFLILFTQLFCEQYHPTLAFLPYFAIGGGSLLATLWDSSSSRKRAAALLTMAFVGAWQLRALSRFDKVFLERSDIREVQKGLADDHRNIVVTNCLVDATTRYYFDRHALGAPTHRTVASFGELFERYGAEEPISYIEYTHLEKMAFDKILYSFFGAEKRWSWIGDPEGHVSEWTPRVVKPHAQMEEIIYGLAPPIVDTGRVRLHRVSFEMFDRYQTEHMPTGDTRFIDFEGQQADVYKVYGFGPPEQYGIHRGFSWMHGHQKKRMIFTLKGLKEIPAGPSLRTAALRVRLSPDHAYHVETSGFGAKDGIALTLRVNGSAPVGTMVAETPFKKGAVRYELVIPKDALRADGIQRLEFEFSDTEPEYFNAVALEYLRFDPMP